VPGLGTDGEASGPSEFEMAYENDESRRRLLWEQEGVAAREVLKELGLGRSRPEPRAPT
jgi:hypothetical protein